MQAAPIPEQKAILGRDGNLRPGIGAAPEAWPLSCRLPGDQKEGYAPMKTFPLLPGGANLTFESRLMQSSRSIVKSKASTRNNDLVVVHLIPTFALDLAAGRGDRRHLITRPSEGTAT
jgi:hypothetical protein